jgi:hypothetical protein
MGVTQHEVRRAWVVRVFGIPPLNADGDALKRAKDLASIIEQDFRNFAGALNRLRGGDTYSADMTGLRKELDALKPGEAAKADTILDDLRGIRDAAGKALDAEDERRRKIVGPLDTDYANARVTQKLADLSRGIDMLDGGDARKKALTELQAALAAARASKGLSMMLSMADEFDAAALVARKAAKDWDTAAGLAEAAIDAEQKARKEKLAALASEMKLAKEKLEAAMKSPVLVPKDNSDGAAATVKNRLASLGKAVPGWSEREAQLTVLANKDAGTVPALAFKDYKAAIEKKEKACKSVTDMADNVTKWARSFGEILDLGASTVKQKSSIEQKYEGLKAGLAEAMKRVAAAINSGDFAAARKEIEALTAVMGSTDAASIKAAGFTNLGSALTNAQASIGKLLETGDRDGAVKAAADLLSSVNDAAGTADALPKAAKTWDGLGKKPLSVLVPLSQAITRLMPAEPKRSNGGLLNNPADLANAQIFVAAVGGFEYVRRAADACLEADYDFKKIMSPQADVFARRLEEIIATASPAADPRFSGVIAGIGALTKDIQEAWTLRAANRERQRQIETSLTKTFGKDTAAGKRLLELLNDVSLDTGSKAEEKFVSIEAIAKTLTVHNAALDRVISEGEASLGGSNIGLGELVNRKQAAQAAVANLISKSDADPGPRIEALKKGYAFVAKFSAAQRKADQDIQQALTCQTPAEVVAALRSTYQTAMDAAQKLDADRAETALDQAMHLAAAITAATGLFQELDALIAHGTPDQQSALPAKRTQAVQAGLKWAGTGSEYVKQFHLVIGDLKAESATGYQAQRDRRDPDDIVSKYQAIVPVYASLSEPPAPPADPDKLIKQIDAAAKGGDVAGAFQRMEREFDPLATTIKDIHPKLAEITGFQNDWAAMRGNFNTALTDAHPKHEKELTDARDAAFAVRLANPAKGRQLLAPLPARIAALDTKKTGWKATVVPKPAAQRPANQMSGGQLMLDAKNLLSDGGISVGAIGQLVAQAARQPWGATANYPDGFDFQWVDQDGKTIRIYGHGPSVGNNVADDAISAQGNIVRIVIGNQYLRSDGTSGALSNNDIGHIPLFGGP